MKKWISDWLKTFEMYQRDLASSLKLSSLAWEVESITDLSFTLKVKIRGWIPRRGQLESRFQIYNGYEEYPLKLTPGQIARIMFRKQFEAILEESIIDTNQKLLEG